MRLFLFFLLPGFLVSCDPKKDPNEALFRHLQIGPKPHVFDKRRVNLDKSIALETIVVYQEQPQSPWKMAVLHEDKSDKKKDADIEDNQALSIQSNFEIIDEMPEQYSMDRLLVKDFFRDGYNSVNIIFSRLDTQSSSINKLFLVYRYPFDQGPIYAKEYSLPVGQKTENDLGSDNRSNVIDEMVKWEDSNEDGRLEILFKRKNSDNDKESERLDYAYSRQNLYQDYIVYKFNGIEFTAYDLDKPFFYYRQIYADKNVKAGRSLEVIYRIANLGGYTSKAYITFSFSEGTSIEEFSLPSYGKVYRSGSSIYHLANKGYFRNKKPVLEYTIYPWPSGRTYTFKTKIKTPKDWQREKLEIHQRSAVDYRSRNIYLPDPQTHSAKTELDQQGYPAYIQTIKIIP